MKSLRLSLLLAAAASLIPRDAEAQLFDNLRSLADSIGDLGEVKSIITADFDRDGHADFAVAGVRNTLTICYGDGSGAFPVRKDITLPDGTSLRQVISTDVDEDGNPDLLTADPFTGQLHIVRNTGGRAWQMVDPVFVSLGVRNLAAGDFNGDGHTDLVLAGPNLPPVTADPPENPVPVPVPAGVIQLNGTGDGSFTRVAERPHGSPDPRRPLRICARPAALTRWPRRFHFPRCAAGTARLDAGVAPQKSLPATPV